MLAVWSVLAFSAIVRVSLVLVVKIKGQASVKVFLKLFIMPTK